MKDGTPEDFLERSIRAPISSVLIIWHHEWGWFPQLRAVIKRRTMATKHEGINAKRIEREPLEAQYAKEWAEQAPRTLGYLLCGQERTQHEYTQRDATVAATIIQWLGSPVGSSFVEDVLRKNKRAK